MFHALKADPRIVGKILDIWPCGRRVFEVQGTLEIRVLNPSEIWI